MIPAGAYVLRPLLEADAAEMSLAVRESVDTVGRWMSWVKPDFSRYDAACWIAQCQMARAEGTAHEFGVFDADGQFLGCGGLNQISTLNKFCNLGYWVRQRHQRAGAATATVLALRDLAFGPLGLERVEIVVAEENLASMGVARKAGASYECLAGNRLQLHGKPVAAHMFAFARGA